MNDQTEDPLVPRTAEELKDSYEFVIQTLKENAEKYDNGGKEAAADIALKLRILLWDKGRNKSILGQMGLKEKFWDTATIGADPLLPYAGLVSVMRGYVPHLDDFGPDARGLIPFGDWWSKQIVIDDRNALQFNRERIVLEIADTDGGAHIDPQLKAQYAELKRGNPIGWKIGAQPDVWVDLKDVHHASVRQIAHEVLKTLDPNYVKRRTEPGVAILGIRLITS